MENNVAMARIRTVGFARHCKNILDDVLAILRLIRATSLHSRAGHDPCGQGKFKAGHAKKRAFMNYLIRSSRH
jgi:hypothetical protein